jgi:prephenate dehydrogenase
VPGPAPTAEPPPRVAILGVGLIGGSLGMAWRRRGACSEVVGFGRSADRLERARSLGAVDRGTTDLAAAVAGADVVVLATPVETAIALAPSVAAAVRAGALVTDVCSTKAAICRAMAAVLPPGAAFVGGHPMAGLERAGVEAADPYLFENAVYVMTPAAGSPPWAVERLRRLVLASGAHAAVLPPERHDAWVAAVSHLPQLAAVALVNAALDADAADPAPPGLLSLAGGGFRDTTRIASSPADTWWEVLDTNRGPVLAALDRFEASLAELRRAVTSGGREAVEEAFRRAAAGRARVPQRTKGLLPTYHDLTMYVEDRPGIIGRLATTLGEAGVNIQDIEIVRLREGEGGTLRLGFASAGEAERAVTVLRGLGVEAQRR